MNVIEVAQTLIRKPSVTPDDAGCQKFIGEWLEPLGFCNESMFFVDTTNLWARKGNMDPVFCFAGHTDVVPTGPLEDWLHAPFDGLVDGGVLHGRGAADMKGSLAAMLVATKEFVEEYPDHLGSIAFLITSDEEGPFINGTTRVIDTLESRGEKITYCLVGEPSSTERVGDIVKYGRRGSLTGTTLIKGVQGHVAYPHLAVNPIHSIAPAIAELTNTSWDNGNHAFPATTFQISNIHAGTGAGNVIPGECEVQYNFRYSTEVTAEHLKQQVNDIFKRHGVQHNTQWVHNGMPFLTDHGKLLEATRNGVKHVCGSYPELSTAGGTSDGRFIAPTGAQVIELGPTNATIHKVNECVATEELEQLTKMYKQILINLMT